MAAKMEDTLAASAQQPTAEQSSITSWAEQPQPAEQPQALVPEAVKGEQPQALVPEAVKAEAAVDPVTLGPLAAAPLLQWRFKLRKQGGFKCKALLLSFSQSKGLMKICAFKLGNKACTAPPCLKPPALARPAFRLPPLPPPPPAPVMLVTFGP